MIQQAECSAYCIGRAEVGSTNCSATRSLLQPKVPLLCRSAVGDIAGLKTAFLICAFSTMLVYGV